MIKKTGSPEKITQVITKTGQGKKKEKKTK